MARPRRKRGQLLVGRYFGVLLAILIGLYATVVFAGPGSSLLTPKLGLDLEGGAQVILTPKLVNGGTPKQADIDTAIGILRQRVDGAGVSNSEVTSQGSQIVVQVPKGNRASIAAVTQTAELNFRQVVQEQASTPTTTTTTTVPTPSPTGGASVAPSVAASAAPSAKASAGATAAPRPSATVAKRPLTSGLLAASPSPTPRPRASATPSPKPTLTQFSQTPQSGDVYTAAGYQALNCADPKERAGGVPDQPGKQIIACSTDGTFKYQLDVAKVVGRDVKSASVSVNQTNGQPEVIVSFTNSGQDKFTAQSQAAFKETAGTAANQVAITLDGVVVSAPAIQAVIAGDAQISGSFSQKEAENLANDLKYGALPLTLTAGDTEVISASLGGDQLHSGLLAGGIGLALVVVYSLIYYRVLGFVTISSLLVSAALVYGSICLLGKELGLSLSLAGIAGFIVSIGITADSFVVYFERLKDEIKEGRTPRSAVDRAWVRARRTILSADTVSILAAVILYFVSIGDVRGFAFTLGLSTLLDIVVVFLFTRPLITVLSRYSWFSRSGPTGFFGPDGGQPSTGGAPRRSLARIDPTPPALEA